MRTRASLSIVGLLAVSAAVSGIAAVAHAAGEATAPTPTWGGASAPAPSVVDAGAPAPSTWGGAPASEASDASAAAAAPSAPRSTWGSGQVASSAASAPIAATTKPHPAPPAAAADAGAPTEDAGESGPSDVGLSLGVRSGYGIPFGSANGGSLSSVLFGEVPIEVDAGWFFSPHLYVGAYFIYGIGIAPGLNNDECNAVDQGCNATMIRLGLVSHWHFNPHGIWDPWVGGGLGYETILLSDTTDTDGSTVDNGSLSGIDLSLEAGIDFKPLHFLGFGPYVEVASGPYFVENNCSSAAASDTQSCSLSAAVLHGWFSFGARFRTNLL